MRPITPQEVDNHVPEAVIAAFNELIQELYEGNRALVLQSDVIERIKSKLPGEFNFSWLNIESHYREAGWHVEYDKPAYNENYPAIFTFTKPRQPARRPAIGPPSTRYT